MRGIGLVLFGTKADCIGLIRGSKSWSIYRGGGGVGEIDEAEDDVEDKGVMDTYGLDDGGKREIEVACVSKSKVTP